jgi:UDP-glucose 4-epimerase
VTGAAGFIGSHLSERLIRDGAEVIGLDAFTSAYDPALKKQNVAWLLTQPRFTLIRGEIASVALPELLRGVTHVVHLAGQAGVRDSWGADFRTYVHHNIEATQRLLEACVGLPLEKVVCASSSSVYGDVGAHWRVPEMSPLEPVSPYGVTKLAAERLCHAYHVAHGVPTVALRYFTVYGPRQRPDMGFSRFMRAVVRGEAVTQFGDGRQTRDFTFVTDAVAATVSAVERGTPGAVYNIGGGASVSLLDVFRLVEQATGLALQIQLVDAPPGEMRHTYADTSAAAADLAFHPTVTLEDGLRAQFASMIERRPEAA